MSRTIAWTTGIFIALAISAGINLDLGPDDTATEATIAADVADAQASATQTATAKGVQP